MSQGLMTPLRNRWQMGDMADQITHFHLIEPVGLVLSRITVEALAIRGGKPSLFSPNLKLGDRKFVGGAQHQL
ncbi:hypothetical protein AO284_17495 [Pseudomonas sp. NZIPFR-PS2]|nr:hypothetical protein AO284_17495 [Pseudomonas sp. NZIPFR-PS2]